MDQTSFVDDILSNFRAEGVDRSVRTNAHSLLASTSKLGDGHVSRLEAVSESFIACTGVDDKFA